MTLKKRLKKLEDRNPELDPEGYEAHWGDEPENGPYIARWKGDDDPQAYRNIRKKE